ncbi:multicomponent Na+:H+ antiporter subunit F [Devosia crocina]|uniref:Multicomponent Na+:H+ antiporter subunit F n=1 Tax=Devosia crocina TaxID=429728 RepID=A0A1I7NRL0_9HYPH|nr:monovalent cation/H+ antiporter complex subunit F [Devosia crocina]SFV37306.1 multicomponent Na+:H+ antiporter subunit F [Devosia crocina]
MTLPDLINYGSYALLVALCVPLLLSFFRMLRGPGVADRFVALDMLTGIAVAMAALAAIVTGRREFLDVAFGLAVFGFVGTCALAAFLERKGGNKQ